MFNNRQVRVPRGREVSQFSSPTSSSTSSSYSPPPVHCVANCCRPPPPCNCFHCSAYAFYHPVQTSSKNPHRHTRTDDSMVPHMAQMCLCTLCAKGSEPKHPRIPAHDHRGSTKSRGRVPRKGSPIQRYDSDDTHDSRRYQPYSYTPRDARIYCPDDGQCCSSAPQQSTYTTRSLSPPNAHGPQQSQGSRHQSHTQSNRKEDAEPKVKHWEPSDDVSRYSNRTRHVQSRDKNAATFEPTHTVRQSHLGMNYGTPAVKAPTKIAQSDVSSGKSAAYQSVPSHKDSPRLAPSPKGSPTVSKSPPTAPQPEVSLPSHRNGYRISTFNNNTQRLVTGHPQTIKQTQIVPSIDSKPTLANAGLGYATHRYRIGINPLPLAQSS